MKSFFGKLGGATLLAIAAQGFAASGDEAVPAAAPVAPAVVVPAAPPGTLVDPSVVSPPAAPGIPALPGVGTADLTGGFGAPGATGGITAIPTPPPLTGLSIATDSATTETTSAVAAQSGPVETYEFLFREDADIGVVREKYTFEEGQRVRNAEIGRFVTKYQQPAGQQPQQGQDPRAGAEWDFYYQQFELYNRYVKERLLPDLTAEELPTPAYDAANYLQERNDIKAAYDKAAISMVNAQSEENQDFYDRLQEREDRRRAYYEWLATQQRELDEWAMIWARRVNGLQWRAEEQPIRRDDWYYGVNFASAEPKIIKMEGREYLVSQEPQKKVPVNQLNVLSSNLTPYDIIDRNGELKTPEMERVRGTAVIPPEDPLPTPEGTLELTQ